MVIVTTESLDLRDDVFGKNFFDSGQQEPGKYCSYSFFKHTQSFKPLCEIIKDHFNPKRVLDIGCAKGSFVYAFRQSGIDAFGIDVSEYAISCAPMILRPFLSVVDLDKDCLPYKDNSFDFITFFGSIEYLHNHRHAIAELERVLAKGGILMLTTIYKKPTHDVLRINIHNKAFWLKEFGEKWRIPGNFYGFMTDYFRRRSSLTCNLGSITRCFFGRSKFSDRLFVHLWDVFVSFGIFNYGIILLRLSKL